MREQISAQGFKNNRYKYLFLLLLSCVFSCCCPLAYGHHRGKQTIIHFKADSFLFDHNTNRGVYQGHIQLIQGTRVLIADYAMSYANPAGEIVKIIALGHPAVYRDLIPHKHPQFIATGDTIYYYPLTDCLEAVGNAHISQGQNHFRGPRIDYDFSKKTVGSPATPNGRTRILLAPLETPRV